MVLSDLYPGIVLSLRLSLAKFNLAVLRSFFVATGFAPVRVDIPLAAMIKFQ